jgi:hypothetical protein
MKINEITGAFKVMRSTPQEVQLQSPTDKTTITTTPAAFSQNPTDPKSMVLNLGNAAQAPGQPTPPNPNAAAPTPAPGQPTPPPNPNAAAPAQPTSSNPNAAPDPNAPAPAPGQPNAAVVPGQLPLPEVGSEVELPDDIGSTMQSETFNNSDLVKNGNKPIGGRKGKDETDDFIDDVTDHDFEKHAGRSKRNYVKPEPIRESEDLIAMLTIAGLR